jgi:hypothetical protein
VKNALNPASLSPANGASPYTSLYVIVAGIARRRGRPPPAGLAGSSSLAAASRAIAINSWSEVEISSASSTTSPVSSLLPLASVAATS